MTHLKDDILNHEEKIIDRIDLMVAGDEEEVEKYIIRHNQLLKDHDQLNDLLITAVHEGGNVKIMKILVENGADIFYDSSHALHTCAYNNYTEAMKYLFSEGEDPDNIKGDGAYHNALKFYEEWLIHES